jgi:hypothetical protein
MKIRYLILLIMLASSPYIFGLHYYSKDYYYSIDLPDSWEIGDDTKKYDAFFRNDRKDSFAEVCVFDVDYAKNTSEMLKYFIKRFDMEGNDSETVFCKYKAVTGEYSLNYSNMDLMMNIVVFKDDYFYYIVMGYAVNSVYKKNKNDLIKIMNTVKIYYDNNIVYSNDGNGGKDDANSANSLKKNEAAKNDKIKTTTKDKNEYTLHAEWDKYNENFTFIKEDYYNAMAEMQAIVDPSIWSYFNIDTNSDSDYNFTFWKKFYQEMYNKNYPRVTNIAQWFKDEAKSKNWSSYDLASNVMKFIQKIPYERPYNVIKDKEKAENILDYFTPNEIAYYDKGDCDTKSMFMVMILRQLGYDAVIYYSYSYSHAMAGINLSASGTYTTYNNKKYYFIESTYPGWKIGDLPPQMSDTAKWKLVPIR